MHRIAPSMFRSDEDDQFGYLNGFQLTVTSAVAAIDLGATALAYLAGGAQRARSSLAGFDADRQSESYTPGLDETTNAMADVNRFADVRNALVHRHVPTSVTVRIGATPSYCIRVEEVAYEVAVDPSAAYELPVDRFVALGRLLLAELDKTRS